MYQLPGNHPVLAFSDPAGANACIAIAEIYRLNGCQNVPLLYTNRIPEINNLLQLNLTEQVIDFNEFGIDCLFTGTSHPESSKSFEVNYIKEAKKKGVYTISFIDHWVNFRLRFQGLNENEYPDEIWVVDEAARKLAVEDGLSDEKVVVKGNPYHFFLKNYWQSSFSGKSYLGQYNIPEDGIHILFAPDPLSLRNGKEKAGFTEDEALNDLMELLSRNSKGVHLLIKCHPLQPKDVLLNVIHNHPQVSCYFIPQANTPELISASDIVIGFHSNILLESAALNKTVIRYFPGIQDADLLKHNTILEKSIINKEKLGLKLNQLING